MLRIDASLAAAMGLLLSSGGAGAVTLPSIQSEIAFLSGPDDNSILNYVVQPTPDDYESLGPWYAYVTNDHHWLAVFAQVGGNELAGGSYIQFTYEVVAPVTEPVTLFVEGLVGVSATVASPANNLQGEVYDNLGHVFDFACLSASANCVGADTNGYQFFGQDVTIPTNTPVDMILFASVDNQVSSYGSAFAEVGLFAPPGAPLPPGAYLATSPGVSFTPEPGSWVLMLLGVGAAGAVLRSARTGRTGGVTAPDRVGARPEFA